MKLSGAEKMRTIEVKQEEDDGKGVGNESDEEVDDTLSKKNVPE